MASDCELGFPPGSSTVTCDDLSAGTASVRAFSFCALLALLSFLEPAKPPCCESTESNQSRDPSRSCVALERAQLCARFGFPSLTPRSTPARKIGGPRRTELIPRGVVRLRVLPPSAELQNFGTLRSGCQCRGGIAPAWGTRRGKALAFRGQSRGGRTVGVWIRKIRPSGSRSSSGA